METSLVLLKWLLTTIKSFEFFAKHREKERRMQAHFGVRRIGY